MTKSLRKLEQSKYEHKASVSQAVEGYRKLYDEYEETDKNKRNTLIDNTVAEVLKNPAYNLHHATK